MSEFPVTIEGRRYDDRAALVEVLRAWGSARARRHRGDRHSADRFNDAVGASSPAAPALAAAAAELLRTSVDPGVLELVAHLSLPGTSVELYEALVERLEGSKGPPLPPGQGLRHGTLLDELRSLLVEWLPPGRADLGDRARALLRASDAPRSDLAFACRNDDPPEQIIAALRRSPASDLAVDPYLAVDTLAHVVERHPDRAVEVAEVLAAIQAPASVRELVAREIARLHPDWHARRGAELRRALAV